MAQEGKPVTRTEQAISLAARAEGVTDLDLKVLTGSQQVGPMTAVLKRCSRLGRLVATGEKRDGRDVYRSSSNAAVAATPATQESNPSAVEKDSERAPAAKRAMRKNSGRSKKRRKRRPAGSSLETAIRLARKNNGVTVNELVKAVDSQTKGPMVRSIKCGVDRGLLVDSGRERQGETVYVVSPSGATAEKKVAKAKKPKAHARSTAGRGRAPNPLESLEEAVAARAEPILGQGKTIPLEWVVAFNRAFEAFVRELAESRPS